jgi:hypothetical protein
LAANSLSMRFGHVTPSAFSLRSSLTVQGSKRHGAGD